MALPFNRQNLASAPPAASKPQFKASLSTDGALELLIYGDIVDSATISMLEGWGYPTDGLISSLSVKKALDSGGAYSKVRLRINSPGGDAFEGMAIHSLLQACGKPVEAYVDGIAASSASIIAMSADTRVMGRTAMMMIHNAWACCCGNKADMTKMADTLDRIDESIAAAYVDRTKLTLAQVKALMDAESWFSAQDCIDNGLATAIVAAPEKEEAAATAKTFRVLAKLKNTPERFRAEAAAPIAPPAAAETKPVRNADSCQCDCANCGEGNCSDCTNAECDDANCKDCPMQAASNSTLKEFRAALKKARLRRFAQAS